MDIGLDIGYSSTKVVGPDGRRILIPSAVGTPETGRFSLNGSDTITMIEPTHRAVGDAAILQSRFLQRREDRNWIESDEWYTIFLAALSEMTTATRANIRLVTGLPIAFYADRATIKDRLIGPHRMKRENRHAQVLTVAQCHVIPQPFGSLLAETLDDRGYIANKSLALGSIGVIDSGAKTTNLLSVRKLAEIGRETASVNVGAWDAVRALRDWLSNRYPGLEDLRDHQLAGAIRTRHIQYYGDSIDLTIVDHIITPLAEQIITEATRLWNGGATLDVILLTGGGALLLGDRIAAHFPHTVSCQDPVFANALGYYRLSQRLGKI